MARAATTAKTQGESLIGSSTSSSGTKTARRRSTSWTQATFASTRVTSLVRADRGHSTHLLRVRLGVLRWAVREGHLAENVAQRRNATEPIPDDGDHKSGDQQAWSAEDRQQLTSFVDEQASSAIDDVGEDREAAIKASRDRALVYLLSYSGVRGAEILRDRSDERRQGLRWEDVHLEDRYATVFAKKQRLDDRGLPNPVIHPLQMYQKVLDAPSESWPVFPSFHRPTLSQRVIEALDHRGYTDTEIEEMCADRSLIEICVQYDIEPPSITTDAGRQILKRLCEEAGIVLDDDEEYLMPHGARRGAGEVSCVPQGTRLPPERSITPRKWFASTTRISKPANSPTR